MTEVINNHPIDSSRETNNTVVEPRNPSHGGTNEQLEWITQLLSECPEAAQDVHKYLQRKYSNRQQHLEQPNDSTPKRGHPLDESGASSGGNQRQHPPKRFQNNTEWQRNVAQPRGTNQPRPQHTTASTPLLAQTSRQKDNQRQRIPFEQLKHAVSSNLPCFHIQWPPETDRKLIPSAIQASELILKELQTSGISINPFTLVGWAGKRLKLGVSNKDDYAILVASDKWPTKINGIEVETIKPKYVPDAFALVVRYVSQELEEEFVTNEIKRTIASAERIQRIRYAHNRRSNDYRFDVKDYQEYHGIIKLGRIAIGHSWLSVTPFHSGNRLTYCTKCWRLGHLRNKCQSSARCRLCLENFTENIPHTCKQEPKCAQCNGNHHSLDNQCQVIRDYKNQLKVEVEEALNNGKLRRIGPQEKVSMFELKEQEFPALTTTDSHQIRNMNNQEQRSAWHPMTNNRVETEKALENINNVLAQLVDVNQRVENKMDRLNAEMTIVTLDSQLHQAALFDIVNTMQDFIQHVALPSLSYGKMERASLLPVVQQVYHRFLSTANKLNEGLRCNRQISSIPTTVHYNSTANATTIDLTLNRSKKTNASIAK